MRVILGLCLCSLLSGCQLLHFSDGPPMFAKYHWFYSTKVHPHPEPKSRYGNPHSYVIKHKRYYVLPHARHFSQEGIASWYGTKFNGKLTSNRERYNLWAMTAAHKTLPLPTYVRVTHLITHRSIIVRVNDRGPFRPHRIIDLSYAAAKALGMLKKGTAPVRIEALNFGKTQVLQLAAFTTLKKAKAWQKSYESLLHTSLVIYPKIVRHTHWYAVTLAPHVPLSPGLKKRLIHHHIPHKLWLTLS